ncbi:MAG: hypothetical protein V1702_05620 [Candidatus Woesearchaeota archaeon]
MNEEEYQERLRNLVDTLKKSGLAASDEDAYAMAKRMLTIRDIGKGMLTTDNQDSK